MLNTLQNVPSYINLRQPIMNLRPGLAQPGRMVRKAQSQTPTKQVTTISSSPQAGSTNNWVKTLLQVSELLVSMQEGEIKKCLFETRNLSI